MARPSQFNRFPLDVRELFELRVRRDNASPAELVAWLKSEGIIAPQRQVALWINQIKGTAAAANAAAEAKAADRRVERVTGEDAPVVDPLDYLRALFVQALQENAGDVPRYLLDAIKGASILEDAYIKRQRLSLDKRSAQPEGVADLGKKVTQEGIDWVRGNVYGIFDNADADSTAQDPA